MKLVEKILSEALDTEDFFKNTSIVSISEMDVYRTDAKNRTGKSKVVFGNGKYFSAFKPDPLYKHQKKYTLKGAKLLKVDTHTFPANKANKILQDPQVQERIKKMGVDGLLIISKKDYESSYSNTVHHITYGGDQVILFDRETNKII